MIVKLPDAGAASEELAREGHQWWIEAAKLASIDLSGFDPDASLSDRIAWAVRSGLDIAVALSRFSTKLQHSTESQVKHDLEFAANRKIYVPPEFLCIDEAEKGKKVRRDGLDRAKLILQNGYAKVLIVFMISRILRTGYKSFQFIEEEIVEEGLRALSVMQGIDTNDHKTWKALCYLHGLMDDLLLDTIADHCRGSLKTLFAQGYSTGALPVCYHRVEVPGPPTKRGLPRTAPAVTQADAEMLRRHLHWHLDGLPLRQGWEKWVKAGGPCDPRSSLGRMSYPAYRRMLSNPRYIGVWAFGRKKNRWSSKRDGLRQIEQPDEEVVFYRCEELRILSDEDFFSMQKILNALKKGPRGSRPQKQLQLWDLTTGLFFCGICKEHDSLSTEPVRFYQTGARGKGMQCRNGSLCPLPSAVRRKESVLAVIEKLNEICARDTELVEQVICRSIELDADADEDIKADIKTLERELRKLTAKIDDLREMAGEGTEEDRTETKTKIREAQIQRADKNLALTRLHKTANGTTQTITPADVRRILADMTEMLQNAAAGKLDEEAVYKALAVFRRLVGGRIWVYVERRPARKQTIVRAVFRPHLIQAVCDEVGVSRSSDHHQHDEVEVWLREPPLLDRLAPRVHVLIDQEGHSFGIAVNVLKDEGYDVKSSLVWQAHRRYYEMIGQDPPERSYNNGRPRDSK